MSDPYDRYAHLSTEQPNPASENLDTLSPLEFVELTQREDQRVLKAFEAIKDDLAELIEELANRFRAEGRLFYVGAGTSGRLGMLDATECPPTFGSDPLQVQAILAGGFECLVRSVEGAEDDSDAGRRAVRLRGVNQDDLVLGIAASSTTPFVVGALAEAGEIGAYTGLVTSHENPELRFQPDKVVILSTGPEILTGSTRLKAGTAAKMFLNRLTTGAMVQIGKVYQNRMVDLYLTCDKLRERAIRTTRYFTDLSREDAIELLERVGGSVKTAILVHRTGSTPKEAMERLNRCDGHLRSALENDRGRGGN